MEFEVNSYYMDIHVIRSKYFKLWVVTYISWLLIHVQAIKHVMTSILLKSFKLVASTSTYISLTHFYINPYYTLALNKTDNSSGVRPSSWSLFILWKKSCARFFSFNRYNILRGSTL